jgi:hypothetical protein
MIHTHQTAPTQFVEANIFVQNLNLSTKSTLVGG